MDFDKILAVCRKLAVEAGDEILKVYDKEFEVQYKEDKTPLTEADKRSNNIIVEGLKKHFPDYSILSEESKDDLNRLNNDYCFIVDPLDGTKEFVKRNGEFTVNIALSYMNNVVLGVIYVPVTKELYYAAKDKGAYYIKDNKEQKIQVSDRKDDIRMVMSRSHASDKLKELIKKNNIKNTKSAGSSIKGCLIAKGEAEVYYRFGYTMEWDTAAMQCIVEEAGGIFRQMDGSRMQYNRENNLNDKGFYILNKEENKLIFN